MSDITAEIITITPASAQAMLDANHGNRRVNKGRVATYAEAMRRGEWTPTSTLTFTRDGTLLDGQHRLLAVIASGIPIQCVAIKGADDTARETIDTGKSRTFGDLLSMQGVPNATTLAGGIQLAWRIENGSPRSRTVWRSPTTPQLLRYLEANPGFHDATKYAKRLSKVGVGVTPSVSVGLGCLFRIVNADEADAFFDQAKSGAGLEDGNPILALRQRLESSRNVRAARPTTAVVAAWTIKAWNAWMDGRSLSLIKWTRGGSSPEDFPEILGLTEARAAQAVAAEITARAGLPVVQAV